MLFDINEKKSELRGNVIARIFTGFRERELANLGGFVPECQVFQAIPRARTRVHEVAESRNKSCRHFRDRPNVAYLMKYSLPRTLHCFSRGENKEKGTMRERMCMKEKNKLVFLHLI